MSLNTMVVFQEYFKMTFIETLAIQVSKFNEATNNCLRLGTGNHDGDYTIESYMKSMPNMIASRDPRVDQAVADVVMTMGEKKSVKVGRRGGPVIYDAAQFKHINRDPAEAGVVIGENFAEQKFRQYFDLALAILVAALSNDAATNVHDVSVGSTATLAGMTTAVGKYGDASQRLNTWFMHSKPVFDIYAASLANSANLFEYGNVIVKTDPFGNLMIVSDSPSLVNSGPTSYNNLCLTPNSISFEENDDFTQEMENILGRENIGYRWQAEWTFNASVKGYSWDSTNGGATPNDAALVLNTNWDRWATNTHKELPGVNFITD